MRIAMNLVAWLVLSSSVLADDLRAKTSDGREVILKDDGTWSFVEPPTARPNASAMEKTEDAKLAYEGKRKTFAIYLKPGGWDKADKPANPVAEAMFIHKDGDMFAMVIAERIVIPVETLKDVALDNMRMVDPDVKIIHEERRKVNGVDVLCATMAVKSEGISLTFHNYYYSGKAGSLQIVTWTGQNIFEEVKPEVEKFLNGLVILKP